MEDSRTLVLGEGTELGTGRARSLLVTTSLWVTASRGQDKKVGGF